MTSLVRKRVMSWCWAEEWLKIRHDSGCRQDAAAVRSMRHTHSGQEMPGCAHLMSNLWWTNLQDRRFRIVPVWWGSVRHIQDRKCWGLPTWCYIYEAHLEQGVPSFFWLMICEAHLEQEVPSGSCLMKFYEALSGQEVLSFVHLMLCLWGTFRAGDTDFSTWSLRNLLNITRIVSIPKELPC